jgi:Fungal specific transcription factor domain
MVPGYFDVEFWTYFLLQVSQSERTVWYAVLALSVFHEQRLQGRNVKDKTQVEASRRFAIRHYDEAIRRLTGHLHESKDPNSVVLVTCLIFFWHEDLLGNT